MKTILLVLLLLTGCTALGPNNYLASGLLDIKVEVAKKWRKECEAYFFMRIPKIIAYRGGSTPELLPPTEWFRQESRQIIVDKLPHDYYSDINELKS